MRDEQRLGILAALALFLISIKRSSCRISHTNIAERLYHEKKGLQEYDISHEQYSYLPPSPLPTLDQKPDRFINYWMPLRLAR